MGGAAEGALGVVVVVGKPTGLFAAMFGHAVVIKQNQAAQTQLQRSLSYSSQDHSRDAYDIAHAFIIA